ncbi:MAG: hypothetical protein E6J82_08705 [Deltaproteobacteria bacterium]|nr:MAG: hypothetical protein E6J82_08705 [Deltaproteobacteria bacterium]
MNRAHTDEQGSALVEAALVIPVLLLLVCGSVALTDAVALKLKLAEALRYALWESTVFKPEASCTRTRETSRSAQPSTPPPPRLLSADRRSSRSAAGPGIGSSTPLAVRWTRRSDRRPGRWDSIPTAFPSRASPSRPTPTGTASSPASCGRGPACVDSVCRRHSNRKGRCSSSSTPGRPGPSPPLTPPATRVRTCALLPRARTRKWRSRSARR